MYKKKLAELGDGVKEQPELSSFVSALAVEHPRVGEILALHGEPTVRRQNGPGTLLCFVVLNFCL